MCLIQDQTLFPLLSVLQLLVCLCLCSSRVMTIKCIVLNKISWYSGVCSLYIYLLPKNKITLFMNKEITLVATKCIMTQSNSILSINLQSYVNFKLLQLADLSNIFRRKMIYLVQIWIYFILSISLAPNNQIQSGNVDKLNLIKA